MSASDPFHHVRDALGFDIPGGDVDGHHLDIPIPQVLHDLGIDFRTTKFMLLQVLAAAIVFFIFQGLGRRAKGGNPVAGRFWNFWEAIALFIRDEVVRPTIGDHHHDDHHGHAEPHDSPLHTAHVHAPHHDDHGHGPADSHGSHAADKYLPFIWTCFFYILICNLLGAIPSLGSATGDINVTGALALCAFVATTFYGFKSLGVGGFFGNFIPETGVPGPGGLLLGGMMFVIEILGYFVKHGVLAVRLFANIMGGHTVLAVILGFIASAAHQGFALWGLVTFGSVVGQVCIGMLELFVAFLQAYVF
ncbi:MAG: F0F1 ATP synthase subunit A, partial [Planctomycetaceae bacterium]|nr:F0F1 ATP synthase subunit A [Planctomycetaceae bacterium]